MCHVASSNCRRDMAMASGGSDSSEMLSILEELGFSDEVKEKFVSEKITPLIIKDLDKNELVQLGVFSLGDQKRLRSRCHEPPQETTIINEVRRVMGGVSRSSTPVHLNFNPNSLMNRTRRQSRRSITSKTPKKTVMKNLNVIGFDRHNQKQFTTHGVGIVMTGLVELGADYCEDEIRGAICDVICNSSAEGIDCSKYGPDDFQFVKRSGHQFRVPDTAPGFSVNMVALKAIVGQGHLYVRLTKEFPRNTEHWSDDSDFEDCPLSKRPCTPAVGHSVSSVSRAGPSSAYAGTSSSQAGTSRSHAGTSRSQAETSRSQAGTSCSHAGPSRSQAGTSSSHAGPSSATDSLAGTSSCYSVSVDEHRCSSPVISHITDACIDLTASPSSTCSESAHKSSPSPILTREKIYELAPSYSQEAVDTLFECVGGDETLDILLDGIKPSSMLSSLSDVVMVGSPKTLALESEDAFACAVSYYKKPSVDMSRPPMVVFSNMPAIDAGGPSRQFFSSVLKSFRDNSQIFEGSRYRKMPVYSTSIVSGGLFKVLGRVVTHSLLSEGPGFPFLAPCVYRYIATGSQEVAAEFVTQEDHSPSVADMLSKLVATENEEDFDEVAANPHFIRLQTETMCTWIPKVSNRHQIANEFVLHEAVIRRMPVLDSLCEGLNSLGLLRLIRAFPEAFEGCFVHRAGDDVTSECVLGMLKFQRNLNPSQTNTMEMIKQFISSCEESELKKFLCYATGCDSIPPKGYNISIKFISGFQGISASTCFLEISFPDSFETYTDLADAIRAVISDVHTFNVT